MRMSCNGCRVLRKGCSENCSIRPCLQWIKVPQSQANATVFLAKFYGRAGLVNLINAGPEPHRPAIFKSLLYEACGRIVNPIYGSAGLLWTGSWQLCQAAVEAVLKGAPIMPISSESAGSHMSPPLKACDIRHVSKDDTFGPSDKIHKVNKSRNRFKRSAVKKPKPRKAELEMATELRFDEPCQIELPKCCKIESDGSVSHDESEKRRPCLSPGGESGGEADCVSVETVEASAVKPADELADCSDVELELTLGRHWSNPYPKENETMDRGDDDTCQHQTGIDLPPVRSLQL